MRMIVIFHIDDYRVVYYTIIMAVYFTEIIYSIWGQDNCVVTHCSRPHVYLWRHHCCSYWFFRLYCSVSSNSFRNFSTRSGFIFPAFITLRFAFSQLRQSCSSILCLDGFRWLVSMKSITSLYRSIHRSSCVIVDSFLTEPVFWTAVHHAMLEVEAVVIHRLA